MFWPVAQFAAVAGVATYVGIYVYWKHVPHYAQRQRIADIQVGTAALLFRASSAESTWRVLPEHVLACGAVCDSGGCGHLHRESACDWNACAPLRSAPAHC